MNKNEDTLSKDFYDFWYTEISQKPEEEISYKINFIYSAKSLEEARGRILSCEQNQYLIDCLNNALNRKKEADFWIQEAQKWINQD